MQARRYTAMATSLGTLYITEHAGCVIRIGFEQPSLIGAARCDTLPLLQLAGEELRAYLSGNRRHFTFAHDTAFGPFAHTVYKAIAQIPYGHHLTAAELAAAIGQPRSEKAVETLCRCNPLWIVFPCHRVVISGGTADMTFPFDAVHALRCMETRYSS